MLFTAQKLWRDLQDCLIALLLSLAHSFMWQLWKSYWAASCWTIVLFSHTFFVIVFLSLALIPKRWALRVVVGIFFVLVERCLSTVVQAGIGLAFWCLPRWGMPQGNAAGRDFWEVRTGTGTDPENFSPALSAAHANFLCPAEAFMLFLFLF